jgi:hypothetical protein
MMKKLVFCAIAMVKLFTACQKIKNLANINFNIPFSQSVTVPDIAGFPYGATLPQGGLDLPFPPLSVATNAQQIFNQYHASSTNLVDANLSNMDLQITAPAGQYFDFVDSIQIFISTESLPELLVAYLYNIPKGQTKINMVVVPGLNLRSYAVQDSVTLRLNAHVNAIPAQGTAVVTEGTFHVTANPL